jgi:hypothetical protein
MVGMVEYRFNPIINIDEGACLYEIILEEVGAVASGKTIKETIEILLDNIKILTDDYFEKLDYYKGITGMNKMLPYFLKIKQCSSVEELLNLLGLTSLR